MSISKFSFYICRASEKSKEVASLIGFCKVVPDAFITNLAHILNLVYMQNTAAIGNPFADFFTSKSSKFDIDLSQANLMGVLEAYQDHKRKTNPSYSVGSIRGHLERIQFISSHVLQPIDVTDIFYSTLSEYLTNEGVCYSSQQTYISKLRGALEWSTRHGAHVSSTYDCVDIPDTEPFTIALSADDVSHIAHFDVSKLKCRPQLKKSLERVRDMFVLSCNLGQRYSDMKRISPENFERNIFRIIQQKTGNKAVVDLDKYAITPKLVYKILKQYNYTAPVSGDITNYNKKLRYLMRQIGGEFDEEYKIEAKVKGKMETKVVRKCDLIASHTARRTFTTFNSNRNIPLAELSRATGHSSLSSMQKYIKFED